MKSEVSDKHLSMTVSAQTLTVLFCLFFNLCFHILQSSHIVEKEGLFDFLYKNTTFVVVSD